MTEHTPVSLIPKPAKGPIVAAFATTFLALTATATVIALLSFGGDTSVLFGG